MAIRLLSVSDQPPAGRIMSGCQTWSRRSRVRLAAIMAPIVLKNSKIAGLQKSRAAARRCRIDTGPAIVFAVIHVVPHLAAQGRTSGPEDFQSSAKKAFSTQSADIRPLFQNTVSSRLLRHIHRWHASFRISH
jgi:hypothetical protein